MRQAIIVYGLILAVLMAALVLSYRGYSESREVAATVHNKDLERYQEFAREKVIGIQDLVVRADLDMFERVELDRKSEIPTLLEASPLQSVMILDPDRTIAPGGFFTKRLDDAETTDVDETEGFKQLFERAVVPELDLDAVGLGERRHLYRSYGGLPHLFAYTRRFVDGRMFFVVVEADLGYLITSVFPRFFDVKSSYLYQVVDERGDLIYGYDFSSREAAAVAFDDTLSSWRLRVTPRDSPLRAGRRTGLISNLLALAVVIAGLAVVVLAVRRERRVSQLKSEFISNVSHELKTPLSIISMFGELLALGRVKSPEQGREYADIIHRESVRLSRLIDSVLDFAKIERGVDVYEFADEQDLREVVERALEISRHRLQRADMTVVTEFADDLPRVRMDGNAMTLAVLNLIDNALKYAVEGKHLAVRLARRDDGISLDVTDRGPGVAADEQRAIFERFYRSRSVRLKPIRGSGIGLALVRHIAEAHGGEASASAGPDGLGARFHLWIPTAGPA